MLQDGGGRGWIDRGLAIFDFAGCLVERMRTFKVRSEINNPQSTIVNPWRLGCSWNLVGSHGVELADSRVGRKRKMRSREGHRSRCGGSFPGSARALACCFRRPRRKPGRHGREGLFVEGIVVRPAEPPDREGALRNTRGRVCSPALRAVSSTIHDLQSPWRASRLGGEPFLGRRFRRSPAERFTAKTGGLRNVDAKARHPPITNNSGEAAPMRRPAGTRGFLDMGNPRLAPWAGMVRPVGTGGGSPRRRRDEDPAIVRERSETSGQGGGSAEGRMSGHPETG